MYSARQCLRIAAFVLSSFAANSFATEAIERYVTQVNGKILVGTNGAVEELSLAKGLGKSLESIFENAMRSWTFVPVIENNQAVKVRGAFSATLALKRAPGSDQAKPEIINVQFLDADKPAHAIAKESVRYAYKKHINPTYPMTMKQTDFGGQFLFLVKLDAEAKYEKAELLKANLFHPGKVSEKLANKNAMHFQLATVRALKQWEFNPEYANRVVVVPFSYVLRSKGDAAVVWQRAHQVETAPTTLMLDDNTRQVLADGRQASERFKLVGEVGAANAN